MQKERLPRGQLGLCEASRKVEHPRDSAGERHSGGGERGGLCWPIRDPLNQLPEKAESAMSTKQKSKPSQLTAQGAIRYPVRSPDSLLILYRDPTELLQLPV